MANPRFNKQVTQPRKAAMGGGMMRVKKAGGGRGMISGTRRKDEASGFYSPDMGMRGGAMMKKGGKVKKGLYANIHAKKKRIAAGSKEKMRKPGSKGAPTAANFKRAAKTAKKKKNLTIFVKSVKKYVPNNPTSFF